jgi:hypothetical protein
MLRRFTLLVALLISPSPIFAQQQLVLDKLKELNAKAPQPSMAELNRTVSDTAAAYAKARNECAPQAVKLSDRAPITGAAGVLAGVIAGKLRNAWTVYAQHVGCPGDTPIRYMILQLADGSLRAIHVNEGRTFANPMLMRDTSLAAALAAAQKGKAVDPSCTGLSMKMGSTRVTDQSADLGPEIYGARYKGKWTEVWQFETCGHKFGVPVEFTPDGDGGAYTRVEADKIAIEG